MKKIHQKEDLQGDAYLIFKHSNKCSISIDVHRGVRRIQDALDLPIYKVVVHDDRDLSNWMAEHFQVKHESPQLILVRNGKAVWHASHFAITEEAVHEAIKADS